MFNDRYLIARFPSHRSTQSQTYELETIFREMSEGITTAISSDSAVKAAGGNSLRHATQYAQRLLADGKKGGYDEIKKALPAVCFQGVSVR